MHVKVNYKNINTKITIICPIHGEFEQILWSHLQGQGCPKCGDERGSQLRKSTTEEFIKKAKAIHGNKYDYSKVEYGKNNMELVCIICPKHGEFWQKPFSHLSGRGCPVCKEW